MKQILYTVLACISILLSSCMGKDYAEAGYDENPYGNNELTESNVVSIAQLKERYASSISTSNAYEQVTTDLQIKGVVTSSDAAGNIYNEVAVQDETGAILVSVSQSGIYGYLPVGTEVLIELKGLYVGNYGLQAQIGIPATSSSGQNSIGRIPRAIWDQHYKILGTGNKVEPTLFATGKEKTNWTFSKDAGKLGVLKDVSFRFTSVDSTYANVNAGAGSVSWRLKEQGSDVIVYNSNYADFANVKVPTGKVNITGIIKRYNNQWEIIIRSLDDVVSAE